MKINVNLPSLYVNKQYNRNVVGMSKTLEKLSSGKRINSAGDDAAGMAISEKMHRTLRGLKQASRNTMDNISYVKTFEGALDEVHSMLQRMRELSVQAANDSNITDDRDNIVLELQELTKQIDTIADQTHFNEIYMLKGDQIEYTDTNGAAQTTDSLYMQVGGEELQHIEITLSEFEITSTSLDLPEFNQPSADRDGTWFGNAIKSYDDAIEIVSQRRAKLGAIQNRLETTSRNLEVSIENVTDSRSRIEDVDMAVEYSEYTRYNILHQASTSMLGHSNQMPQAVLQLLNR